MLENFTIHYNQIAKKYTKKQQAFYKKHFDASRKALYGQIDFSIKNKKILDVGCGFGQDLAYFEKQDAKTFGIDTSKTMLDIARENYPFLKNLFKESFEKTHFENDFFDVITSRYTIHYAKDLEKTFKELHRTLKVKGFLIFLVPHPLSTLFSKKKKDYYAQEIIKVPLFEDVIIHEPTHTLSEYFNPFLLESFKIISFSESPRNFTKETSVKGNIPEFFILKLQKIK